MLLLISSKTNFIYLLDFGTGKNQNNLYIKIQVSISVVFKGSRPVSVSRFSKVFGPKPVNFGTVTVPVTNICSVRGGQIIFKFKCCLLRTTSYSPAEFPIVVIGD